ncbi:MAG TPA: YhgE/Pip family protein, partial [Pseudoneobacillus sp.]|nr:YhgE/Pip family protein [Pseudoneobacillus sp.]
VSNGTTDLLNGWNKVANSLGTVMDGEKKLIEGSQKLENGLNNGAEEMNAIHSGQPIYEMMSNPVRLKEKVGQEVPNYGTGMAPFFLSISLYVGALLLSTVFPLRDTHERPPTAFSWFISKFVILIVISLAHSLITDFLLVHLVGIKPLQLGYFYLFSFFSSLMFMSIIQFLVTSVNNVGRFIGIILLVLQLTASSGTFPVELIPTSLQRVHDLLPMTYTVEGFRTLITTGDYEVLYNDILSLVPFFLISILLTLFIMRFLLKRRNMVENT